MKIKMLKAVPPYMPGQEVDVDDALAKSLCDDKKALSLGDFEKAQAEGADVSKLSVAQMQARGLKNVAAEADAIHYARAESAAIAGVPLAHGDAEMTVTGGITPPTKVFAAVAKAQGLAAEEVAPKAEKKDEKKAK